VLIHPARQIPFDELVAGLRQAREQRLVYERHGPEELRLYVYSEHCVFEGAWTPITLAARGLILDMAARRIVATPFPKFFNFGERGEKAPDLPFETLEKLDGSLIIIFHHGGRWRAATKGSFTSSQAQWAQDHLDRRDLAPLRPGTTYLAEAVYPENRIVVRYAEPALVMLAAYGEDGTELPTAGIDAVAGSIGLRAAKRHAFASLVSLVEHAQRLPRSEEGFVLRFENGHRLKVKGAEYRRIHALISRCTPLAMWEAMLAGDDMEAIRRDLPEEFWADFDAIVALLGASLVAEVTAAAQSVAQLPDKEVGLKLPGFDERVRGFIFAYRKSGGDLLGTPRARQGVFRAIRPTANVLEGYVPSHAMSRLIEEAS
jgi:putative RNA ligase